MKGLAVFAACVSTLLAGCITPPQEPIALTPKSVAPPAKIGVAMAQMPKADTQILGASCLLCYAAASAGLSSLTSHTQTLSLEGIPKLKEDVAALIRKKGGDATVIADDINIEALTDISTEAPNVARKDFASLAKKYPVDKILILEVNAIGMTRSYSSYFPTGDPKAMLQGKGYLVNLKNNTYEWYLPVYVLKGTEGNWDEPPKFPGLTNAYYQVLEISKDNFLQPFNK